MKLTIRKLFDLLACFAWLAAVFTMLVAGVAVVPLLCFAFVCGRLSGMKHEPT